MGKHIVHWVFRTCSVVMVFVILHWRCCAGYIVCVHSAQYSDTDCLQSVTHRTVCMKALLFYKYLYTTPDTRKCNFIYTLKKVCPSLSRFGEILKRLTALLSGLLWRIWMKTKDKSGESNRIYFTPFSNCCCIGSADLYWSDIQSVHLCGQQSKGS